MFVTPIRIYLPQVDQPCEPNKQIFGHSIVYTWLKGIFTDTTVFSNNLRRLRILFQDIRRQKKKEDL